MITEVEVYDGPADRASHASRGRTERNQVMFEAGGLWYVYLCYGMNWMLNIVVGPKNYPSAILIRGVEGLDGPGKLTRYLNIDKRFNAYPANKSTGLYFVHNPNVQHPMLHLVATPRIGVAYAGPKWSKKKWRFLIK